MGVRAALLAGVLCAFAGRAPAAPSTMDALAGELAATAHEGLEREAGAAKGRDVAVRVRARDARTSRLADTLGGLLIARLTHDALGFRAVVPFSGDAADARRAGFAALVDAEVGADAAQVVVLARVVDTHRLLWADAAGRSPDAAIAAAPFARARIDPELKAYLDAPPAGDAAASKPATRPVTPTHTARARRLFFRPQKSALDLGAPLLALAAGDVDGDGRADLVALTTDSVAVLEVDRDATRTKQIVTLAGPPLTPRPRDPVGALVVEGGRIYARSSEHEEGVVLEAKNGALVRAGVIKGYPLCSLRDPADKPHLMTTPLLQGVALFSGDGAALEPAWPAGAGALPALPARSEAVGCSANVLGAVDPAGKLALFTAGEAKPFATLDGVGTAFQVADLDDDGQLEVITSTHRAPGGGDALSIWRLGSDGSAQLVRRGNPLTGGIVAIAAGDFDGDGAIDIAAAVRLTGSTRSDLWVLD